jgi:hypothetical protein
MRKSKFTEEQIVYALKQAELGVQVRGMAIRSQRERAFACERRCGRDRMARLDVHG